MKDTKASKTPAGVLRSAGLVGGLTMVSRALGLCRDMATAALFGTSLAMSAFVIAFTVPNLFRRLFGEGALASSFIPVFVETRRADGEAPAWQLARRVITMVSVLLLALVALGVIAATLALARPGLGGKAEMTLALGRIMLPYMFFICLAGLAQAILNSYGHFTLPALTPSLLNLVWLVAVLLVCPRLGDLPERQILGLAWGIVLAGILQVGVQAPLLVRFGYRPGWAWSWGDARVLRVLALMGPAALGLAVTQVNVMIDRLLAGWIGPWAPAALFYSERLLYFPQGILATALSTVLLPVLAGHAARSEHAEIRGMLNHSLRNLLFIMAPAAGGLLVMAGPLVRSIYEWQRFDAASSLLTTRALWFYAPGLLVFCLAKVFVPAFYAVQDTRTPVRVGLWTVGLNIVLNVVFILTWPLEYKHAGIALATVLAEAFNGLMLAVLLHRRLGSPGWRSIGLSAARSLGATAVMGAGVWWAHRAALAAALARGLAPKLAEVGALALGVALGLLLYAGLSALLRCPEFGEVRAAFARRRPRSRP